MHKGIRLGKLVGKQTAKASDYFIQAKLNDMTGLLLACDTHIYRRIVWELDY